MKNPIVLISIITFLLIVSIFLLITRLEHYANHPQPKLKKIHALSWESDYIYKKKNKNKKLKYYLENKYRRDCPPPLISNMPDYEPLIPK